METFLITLEVVNFLGIVYLAIQIRKDRKHDCVNVAVDQIVDKILEDEETDQMLEDALAGARLAVADYERITRPKKKRGRPRKVK